MPCAAGICMYSIIDELIRGPLEPVRGVIETQDVTAAKRWSWHLHGDREVSGAAVAALMKACEAGDVNISDEVGMTALHYACCLGSFRLVNELISANADVALMAASGKTPLDLALETPTSERRVIKYLQRQKNDQLIDDLSWLRNVPLFRDLHQSQLPKLAAAFTTQRFSPGQTIVRTGELADAFYIIEFGEAVVHAGEPEEPVAVLGANDYFGETALLRNEHRTATVRASDTLPSMQSISSNPSSSSNSSCGSVGCLQVRILSKSALEQLKLRDQLKFPRRAAIRVALQESRAEKQAVPKDLCISADEISFIMKALQSNPNLASVLSSLSHDKLEKIAELGVAEDVAAGEVVIKEGDRVADRFFIVESGELSVEMKGNQVRILGPGDSFGEFALLARTTRSATVYTQTSCKLLSLSRGAMDAVMKEQLREIQSMYASLLTTVPDFEGYSLDQRREIADALVKVTYSDGDYIMRQGEAGKFFCILYDGQVDVEQHSNKVSSLYATPASAHHPHFGELALLGESLRTASVRAVGPTEVLVLEGSVFLRFKELWAEYEGPEGHGADKVKVGAYRRNDLEMLRHLGNGAFGSVSLVRHAPSGAKFALKALSKKAIDEQGMERCVLNEKTALRLVDSPFLVRSAAIFNMPDRVEFLMEAVAGGELCDAYLRNELFGEEEVVRFHVACISRGLDHLHSLLIMYRDLKPENVLVDAQGYCKICDFGMSKFTMGRAHTICGTPPYFAPELLDLEGYTSAVDWWALGVMTYELMQSELPFDAEDPMKIIRLAKKGIDKARWPCRKGHWVDFVKSLCRRQPHERLPLQQGRMRNIESHAWFADAGDLSVLCWKSLDARTLPAPWKPVVGLGSPKTAAGFLEDSSGAGTGSDWSKDFEELSGPEPKTFLL